jgi:hypothetical protein
MGIGDWGFWFKKAFVFFILSSYLSYKAFNFIMTVLFSVEDSLRSPNFSAILSSVLNDKKDVE